MGYESKFYIIEKTNQQSAGRFWGQVIGMVDLCKIGTSATWSLINNSPDTDCFIYGSDGNTKILTDCYGDNLKEIEFPAMIKALKKDMLTNEYRRFPILLGFLESFKKSQWQNLKILHYGH